MEKSIIPIKNIYYMLCYAWDVLEEKDSVNVDGIRNKTLLNLFAKILSVSTSNLLKRGLYREYIEEESTLKGIRGKINLSETLRKDLIRKGRAQCTYDEFSYDVRINRIIKTTIGNLLRVPYIEVDIKESLYNTLNHMGNISTIELSDRVFYDIKLHRNNRHYRLPLQVCKIIHECILVNEDNGAYAFKDFLREEHKMNRLFESFVRNFYRYEQSEFKVGREDIRWKFSCSDEHMRYLPKMQTDISLENEYRKIIIDTKYYRNALVKNFNAEKLISGNLYQMFAYLNNVESKGGVNATCEGILLYPTVSRNLELGYSFGEHQLKVYTVDLNGEWNEIEERLLGLLRRKF